MATLNEITFNILNHLRGGRSTNNEYISERQIQYNVQYYRALLARRDGGTGFQDTRELEQRIPFILEEPEIDPDTPTPLFYQGFNLVGKLLQSTKDLPTPVRLYNPGGVITVTSIDFRVAYPLLEPERVRWLQYSKFTSNVIRSFVHDERVWLIVPPFPAIDQYKCMVTGVFEDPKKAHFLTTGMAFNNDLDRYPLPADMEQRIVTSLLNGEFKVLKPNEEEATDILTDDAQ